MQKRVYYQPLFSRKSHFGNFGEVLDTSGWGAVSAFTFCESFDRPSLSGNTPARAAFDEVAQVISPVVDRASRLEELWPYALATHVAQTA